MAKRFLDCIASEIAKMTGKELAAAIAGSEGRILVCETIGAVPPMLGDVTNAEFAAAMGADMLILNLFDVNHPVINGLPETAPENIIREVKRHAALDCSILNHWKREQRAQLIQTVSGS